MLDQACGVGSTHVRGVAMKLGSDVGALRDRGSRVPGGEGFSARAQVPSPQCWKYF